MRGKRKIYLATCYCYPGTTFLSWFVEKWRYHQVCRETARLMELGYNVFSPITHSHPIPVSALYDTHDFWLGMDFDWIDCCDEVWVFQQRGWEKSRGVAAEIEYAQIKGIPIVYNSLTRWIGG